MGKSNKIKGAVFSIIEKIYSAEHIHIYLRTKPKKRKIERRNYSMYKDALAITIDSLNAC